MSADAIILINTGVVFCLGGALLFYKPPKRINQLYGYRTRRSMKSQEAWNLAQKLSARAMIRWGIVQLGMALLAWSLKDYLPQAPLLALVGIIGSVVAIIAQVELQLKKTFD